MKQLYIEITIEHYKETVNYTGRFKIWEDNKNLALAHMLIPCTVDWKIEEYCKKLGFKDSYDCLEKSMYYIVNNNLIPKLKEKVGLNSMQKRLLFNVNKYKKRILSVADEEKK